MSEVLTPDEINGLIERLRKAAAEMRAEDQPGWPNLCDEAANALHAANSRITELTAEVERPREALEMARAYVERDEAAHGRSFGTGNAIRATLSHGEGK